MSHVDPARPPARSRPVPDPPADGLSRSSSRCTGPPSRTPGRSRRSTSPPTSATCSAKMTDAERHLVQRLVAFFATGDSIVANNLVLNLYRHLNAPEARMYLSRQLYEEALHVQFYLTLLDTYVPDPDERHQAFAAVENIPSIRKQGRVLHALAGLDPGPRPAGHGRAPAAVPAQPDLLRGLHRGAVLLRRLRLRVLPALARAAARAGGGDELGVPRRERAHGLRLRGGEARCGARSPSSSTRAWRRPCATMLDEAIDCETQFAEDLLGGGVAGLSVPTSASISSSAPISGWPRSGCRGGTGRRTRSRSWICRTSRS